MISRGLRLSNSLVNGNHRKDKRTMNTCLMLAAIFAILPVFIFGETATGIPDGDMDAGGTQSDYAVYVVDGIAVTNSSLCIGRKTAYNELAIINGGTYTCNGSSWVPSDRAVGYGPDTHHNKLTVSGEGSAFISSGGGIYLSVGYKSDNNSVTVEDGARMEVTNGPKIGTNDINGSADPSGCGNQVVIDNSQAEWQRAYLGCFSGASNNVVIVRNGASLSMERLYLGYDSTNFPGAFSNSFIVDGENSRVCVNGIVRIGITDPAPGADYKASAVGNTLTVSNSGEFYINCLYGGLDIGRYDGAYNKIRLASGTFIQTGNIQSLISDGDIQVWNRFESKWEDGIRSENFSMEYYAPSSDSEYAGCTVISGGDPYRWGVEETLVILIK